MKSRTRQRGTTTVEFAIVGLVLMMVLFAAIEFGRIIFTLNVLQEAARRGARVAAICAVNDPGVADAAVFTDLRDFTTANVAVEYLDENGAPTGSFDAIHYVRARVVDYPISLNIPLFHVTFDAPEFSSTLPRESLGIPKSGAPPAC